MARTVHGFHRQSMGAPTSIFWAPDARNVQREPHETHPKPEPALSMLAMYNVGMTARRKRSTVVVFSPHSSEFQSGLASLSDLPTCLYATARSALPFLKLYVSPSTSMRTSSPGAKSPARIRLANGFSISCWIRRLRGRAP